ncbi:multidrug effflux MFS transporter [Legionella sp. CNM-1927-20]|uniref:multidrug effflux MFS transporter n=1 Tax=Legionella sp. CNM-1927-20 TaxID=3422221 RepID=UPI00403B3387
MKTASYESEHIPYALPSLLLIIYMVSLPQISETIYSPALPQLTAALKTTSHLVQWSLSIYFIGFAVGVAFWGKLSDHIGRRPTILVGLVIYLLFSIFCGLSTHIYWLLSARFFQAFGINVGSVITQAIMRDCYDGVERNKIFALAGMVIAFAPAVGPIIGGHLTEWFSWTANFTFLALLGSFLFIYAYMNLPETYQYRTSATSANSLKLMPLFLHMLKDKHVMASAFLVGGFNGILFSYYSEAPYLFINLLGMASEHYGMLGMFMATGVALGSFLSHRVSQRCSALNLTRLATLANLIVMAVCFTLVRINIINTYNLQQSVLLIMPCMMLFYVCFGLAIPNILSKALVNYQENIGAAGSIPGLIYYCWAALSIFGIGLFIPKLHIMPGFFLGVSGLMFFSSFYLVDYSK